MTTSPWEPPPTPPRRGRVGLGAVIAALLAVTVGVSFVALGVRHHHASSGERSAANTPLDVVRAYLHAAQSGNRAAMTALVAPSQRTLVTRIGLLPLGATSLTVVDGVDNISDQGMSLASPDTAVVRMTTSVCLQPQGECGQLAGAHGDEHTVLVLREGSRWWMTAQPFTLGRPDPKPSLEASIRWHLVLHGGRRINQSGEWTKSNYDCAHLGLSVFGFDSEFRQPSIDMTVGVADAQRNRAGSYAPYVFSLSLGDAFNNEYEANAPVHVELSTDGTVGTLPIRGWTRHAQFSLSPRAVGAPVNGVLTVTCSN